MQDPKDGAKSESTIAEEPTSKPVSEAATAPASTPVVVPNDLSRTTAPEPEADGELIADPSDTGKRGSRLSRVSFGSTEEQSWSGSVELQKEEFSMAKTYSRGIGSQLLAAIDAGDV